MLTLAVAEEIDRVAPGRRPTGPLAGYHRWHDLLFIHWRVPAETIAPLLPRPLTLDTFDGTRGSAWCRFRSRACALGGFRRCRA